MTRARDLADSADKDIAGTVTLDDIILSNDITLADNGKAIFGAGSDLQIYHNGSHSIIADVGTGNLNLYGENLNLQNSDGTENYIRATVNSDVKLYYDNAAKLATTSTGIDVTGTVTADAVSVNNDAASFSIVSADLTRYQRFRRNASNSLILDKYNGSTTTNTVKFDENGDITFYDTSGNASFVYDESAGSTFNEQGADRDFRVESNNSTHALFVNAAVSRVGIKTASPDYELQVGDDNTNVDATIAVASAGSSTKRLVFYRASNKDWEIVEDTSENLSINSNGITGKEFVINNASNDTDFRVESDSNANMLFVDAGNNHVNIGTSNDYDGVLNVFTTGNDIALSLVSDNGNASVGPILKLVRKSSSPADGDLAGEINFSANNSAAETFLAKITARQDDVSNATEDSTLTFTVRRAGASDNALELGSATVFNNGSANRDFRVESDSNSNAFVIDAGNNLAAFAVATSLYDGSAGNSPSLIFGGETAAGPQKSIYLDTYYMVHQIHVNEGVKFRFTNGNVSSFDDRHIIRNNEVVFNETSKDTNFRVETDNINDAFEIDASQDVIKFKTNVWQHAPLTGGFSGGWVTVTNLDTLGNLISNSAAKIRVYANENGRTNVSYSEHLAVRTNGTWALQQLGEVTSGNSHGNANIQMSGTNLQIKNAASSSIGAWKVSLELFR